MVKQLIVIEGDFTFVQKLRMKLKDQFLDEEFTIVHIVPDITVSKGALIRNCIEHVEVYREKGEVAAIFVDINISEDERDIMGIELSVQLKKAIKDVKVFPITAKHAKEFDFDNISEATLEDIDGVFIKSFLTGKDFSASRLRKILSKPIHSVAESHSSEDSKFLTCDIVVVVAIEMEYKELEKIFEKKPIPIPKTKLRLYDNSTYFETYFIDKNGKEVSVVLACDDRMGMTSAASLTSRAIFQFKPSLVVMVGIAAGIEGDSNIGDILIPQYTYDYGSGKMVTVRDEETGVQKDLFKPYIDPIPLDEYLRNLILNQKNEMHLHGIRNNFMDFPNKNVLKLKCGPFGSGAAVIANSAVIDQLKNREGKLIGFDMEAFGVFNAVRSFKNVKAIVIKSVSDFGNDKKENPLKDIHQQYAAHTSANFLKYFLNNCYPF